MGLEQAPADPGNPGSDAHMEPSLNILWAHGNTEDTQDIPLPLCYNVGTAMTLKSRETSSLNEVYNVTASTKTF